MKIETIENEIYRNFNKVTPTGINSLTRSRNLCSFLRSLIREGISKTKENNSKSKFYSYMKDLKKCGVTEEFINEEYEKYQFKNRNNKKEYTFIEIKFGQQVPDDFIEPKSQFTIEDLLKKDN